MSEAMRTVGDGDVVYVGGFGFAQPFAAVHELIRREPADLHVIRSSGGVLLDQLIGAGCVSAATIAHCWNAVGPAPTSAFRRAAEDGVPRPIEIEEHGLGNLVLRLFAGARRLPFVPAGPVEGTGQFEHQTFEGKFTEVSFDGDTHYVMEPLTPDVGVLHVPRADERGNAQLTGARAEIKHGAMASETLVVTAEEIVPSEEIQDTPDQTILPGFMVDHVVESPGGAHPSGVHGRYPRDIDYLEHYGEVTDSREGFEAYLDDWVYGVGDREEYLAAVRDSGFAEVAP